MPYAVEHITLPARFLATMAHLVATVTVIFDVVSGCLYHPAVPLSTEKSSPSHTPFGHAKGMRIQLSADFCSKPCAMLTLTPADERDASCSWE